MCVCVCGGGRVLLHWIKHRKRFSQIKADEADEQPEFRMFPQFLLKLLSLKNFDVILSQALNKVPQKNHLSSLRN